MAKPRQAVIDVGPYGPTPVRIIEAAVAGGAQPAVFLLLDVSARPDLQEVFETHATVPEGSSTTNWMDWPEPGRSITLFVRFDAPAKATALITFDLARSGNLVDAIIRTKTVRLVAGTPGDSLPTESSATLVSIGVEVSTDGIDEVWPEPWAGALATQESISVDEAHDQIEFLRARFWLAIRFPDAPPLEDLAGAYVDESTQQAVFVTKNTLVNHIRREGPKVADSFDAHFSHELDDLSGEFSKQAFGLMRSITAASAAGDDVRLLAAQLMVNAYNAVTAAIELIRLGYRLQPGALLRVALETAWLAAYLARHPQDVGRFHAGRLKSQDLIGQAKEVLPFIPRVYGDLSKQFAHMGPLHGKIQLVRTYENFDDEAAKTNLLGTRLTLMIIGALAEAVFFDVYPVTRYWKRVDERRIGFQPDESVLHELDEASNRLGIALDLGRNMIESP